ncbi:23S rRNA (pseudouridine(1915)-N(3))-methyltransferase RlmH [uncultured Dubosiella sp.]|uniref:23S rRNA (pseudouridine(1915)-N(3))-methyltransferase RlmH n=1 Tax=uncultured Dubosiella sp. TaxID=1937011 RepID=UPI0025F9354C|nr:23S rRNA (pseudouridine(1915)-N(3))-methyltransferase RlmH [uncultured Dubosiella sp.]
MKLIAVGKNKDKALQSLEKEYIKRLGAFTKMEVIEVRDEANDHADRPAEAELIKDKEGKRVLEKIRDNDFVILLDLHGSMESSESFAKKMDEWLTRSSSLVFVIAGSLGPGHEVLRRANVRWKLSDLTFTHLMTRILVLEQVYRAYMINNHRSYHK